MNRKQHGFTLLEMVIAIAIFAIMSAMAYGGLNSASNIRIHADAQADRLAQLQKAFMIIGRDIEQTIERPVRDNYADDLAAISGGGYGQEILALTRNGRSNPMGQSRSNLQRVGYMLSEGELKRQSWNALDRALDSMPVESSLLDDVKSIELRFMDSDRQWQIQWPNPDLAEDEPPAMPRLVEVTLELEDWGRITRLFEVVG